MVTDDEIKHMCRRLPEPQACKICEKPKSVHYVMDNGVCIICRLNIRRFSEAIVNGEISLKDCTEG